MGNINKSLLNNRELSWLDFNERVMQEAQDTSVPLLQRLRFLGIYSNNLDEFYKVRVAGLERKIASKKDHGKRLGGGYTPVELLDKIKKKVEALQQRYNETFAEILHSLEKENIFILNERQLSEPQQVFAKQYFADILSPRIVPLMIRKNTKLPFLQDDNIYLAVKLTNKKKGKEIIRYSIIQVPVSTASPRFVVLPSENGRKEVMFIDDIIRLMLDDIFFMFEYISIEAHNFKFSRDAEITLDDDVSQSLVEKMETGVYKRLFSRPVRLTYDKEMPQDMLKLIINKFGLQKSLNVSPDSRYGQLRDLMKFPKIAPELEEPKLPPLSHPAIPQYSSFLNVIKKQDIILNYPYHKFGYFIDFLREAAVDPKVESIYITLYRVAEHSKVINALINAAKNGKHVVAVVELLARFDEEHNIDTTEALQQGGVKVINGIMGLKVHSKLALIRRREGVKTVGYTYVGTGNFNETTATTYTDLGFFTYDQEIADDALQVFNFLDNTHVRFECKHLSVSPYQMRKRFISLINKEITNAKAGKPAYIYLKMNSLTDETLIKELYKASMSRVEIRIIVRGACCLKPQMEGISENIRGISIVDKFLEHERFMIFCNNGEEITYISSADWMIRNMDKRVEVAAPIKDKRLKKIIRDIFEIQWNDNVKARDLDTGKLNVYIDEEEHGAPEVRSQTALYDYFSKMVIKQ